MPTYSYEAKDTKGNIVRSSIEADSNGEAVDKISQLGYYPLSVSDASSAHGGGVKSAGFFAKIALHKNVTIFAKQLAGLLKSGIPMLRSLKIISFQTSNRNFRSMLENITAEVKDGASLSRAISMYPGIFNPFFISMARAGEENGMLADSLSRIADYRKKEAAIKSEIKRALTYPALIALAGIVTVSFIMAYVMPKLVDLIQNIGTGELPRLTSILIGSTNLLRHNFLIVPVAFVVAYLLLRAIFSNSVNREFLDSFKLKFPLFGELIFKSDFITFARTMEASLNNGLQMIKALELSTIVVHNEKIRKELKNYCNQVKAGSSFGSLMQSSRLFPISLGTMLSVSEQSGRVAEVFAQIAEEYEQDVEEAVSIVVTLIEPLIIICLGFVIGFIVLGMLLPIFQFNVMVK
ncbi:MAG: type II secretion system F family protein [Candidatus Omnitrophica bacterium]|nr:type II secretion system F family protein [Candidatus Omnitrophota bacterium]